MKSPAVLRTALAAGALFLSCLAFAADLPAKFDPTRDAAKDVAAATAQAKSQGKRVIVDVGGEWCSWCHILDNFIASNADVKSLIDAKYVWVKVNWSPQNKNEALLAKWPKIKGYPHLVVLDADGRLLQSQNTGELEAPKSYDKARFIAFLQKYAGK
jgi:thiol:disulfide interchange protein